MMSTMLVPPPGSTLFNESTSSASGALVRTSALLATEAASMVLRAAFSTSAPESLASFSPSGSSSKTLLRVLLDGSTLSGQSWESSGMQRYLSRLQQAISARRIDDPESCLLPTLTASTYGSSNNGSPKDGKREQYAQKGKPSLFGMAKQGLLPTLTATANMLSPSMQKWPCHRNLTMLPTLCARDEKGPGPAHTRSGSDLPQAVGGHLSPTFCEWFMGAPIGFTLPIATHYAEQVVTSPATSASRANGQALVANASPRSATPARQPSRKSRVKSSASSSRQKP